MKCAYCLQQRRRSQSRCLSTEGVSDVCAIEAGDVSLRDVVGTISGRIAVPEYRDLPATWSESSGLTGCDGRPVPRPSVQWQPWTGCDQIIGEAKAACHIQAVTGNASCCGVPNPINSCLAFGGVRSNLRLRGQRLTDRHEVTRTMQVASGYKSS